MLRHLLPVIVFLMYASIASAADFSITQKSDSIDINYNDKLVTTYHFGKDTNKPYFWPIVGPTGKQMTRAYPMEDREGERQDHPHHRSFWFGHQVINNSDTWHEEATYKERYAKKPDELARRMAGLGSTVHRQVVTAKASGDHAVLVTKNDYLDGKGNKMLEDLRTYTFRTTATSRVVDVEIKLIGSQAKVTIGDAKDAGFSVRVPHSMAQSSGNGGKIINSRGDRDKQAWSKRAEWVDYHGPVEGEHLGIAILNHPSSFRFPTPWHVRTYGLFTANPFGLKSLKQSNESGSTDLAKGESLIQRYRVIFHVGDEKTAGIQAAFDAYAKESF